MGFMEKVIAATATKYGIVIEGKHKGNTFGLGVDKELSSDIITTTPPTQIVFFDGTKETARYNFEDFKQIKVVDDCIRVSKLHCIYKNGDEFVLDLDGKEEGTVGKIKNIIGLNKDEYDQKRMRFLRYLRERIEN